MVMVGVSAMMIPSADSMVQLIIPHLGLGLGIGIADAALVPLLASLVDQTGGYGPVYSVQQMAVSLAYSLGIICFKDNLIPFSISDLMAFKLGYFKACSI